MPEIRVPDIGDFSDVAVVEILVSPGQQIAVDQPLITLESDKANMEVPSPLAGTIAELAVSVGDRVSEGALIARLQPAADAGALDTASQRQDQGTADEPTPEVLPPATEAAAAERVVGSTVYASPAVRRAAHERGVDLAEIDGTGRRGRITVEDLMQHVERDSGSSTKGVGLPRRPRIDFSAFGPVEKGERSLIKQLAAANLARSWSEIPHVTHHDLADVTETEQFRRRINDDGDVKVTMLALLLRACAHLLRRFPTFNASLDEDGELILKRYYHLGFAADTPQGLVVPVVRDAGEKGVIALAAEIAELAAAARARRLTPAQMRGGTFTVSSLGGIGGTGFTPIINTPEVAILGVSRTTITPRWDADSESFQPRLMLPLSLSYDHRVIDGAEAARFCAELARTLADLRRVLI